MKIGDLTQSQNTKVVLPSTVASEDSVPVDASSSSVENSIVETAVKSSLPKIIDDLMQNIIARQTALDSLPVDLKNLLQQKLSTSQPGLNTVEQGAAAMYKSDRSAVQMLQSAAQDLQLSTGLQQLLDSSSTSPGKLMSIVDKMAQNVQSATSLVSFEILSLTAESLQQNQLSPQLSQALSTFQSLISQNPTLNSLSESVLSTLSPEQMPSLVETASQNFSQPELAKLWATLSAIESGSTGINDTQINSFKQLTDPVSNFLRSATSGTIVEQVAVLIAAALDPLQKSNQFQTKLVALLSLASSLTDSVGEDTLVNQLVDLLKNNFPKVSADAQTRYSQDDMNRLLTLGKLVDLKPGLSMEAQVKQAALSTLRELEKLYREPEKHPFLDRTSTEKSFSFQMVLYAGELPRPYPATINIFRDVKGKDPTAQPDIWLRITIGTDHMGPVDLVFRLHEQKVLSIRATFSNSESAEQFRMVTDELKNDMKDSSLTLKEIIISDTAEGTGK